MTSFRYWLSICLALWLVNASEAQTRPAAQKTPQVRSPTAKSPLLEKSRPADASDAFFNRGTVAKLKIEIPSEELQKLRENNREYVQCNLIENGSVTYKAVAIKLKGAAGSFREFDDRPALTLNMNRFTKQQTFHELAKFHLNNSVQDETYLNELICSEIFRKSGLPAPRVTHARVWLNGRDVGLYVLKEGFDRKFLRRHFSDPTGNLYDGGFLQDLDVDLEKDSGNGPDDHSDLHALRDACAEPDPATRWTRIAALLDVDQFIDFMALELMTGHWDGYTLTKNNYRIYFHPTNKRAYFLPHGMDQMFGDPAASVLDYPGAIVSSAVMQNPAWREKYRARLKWLLPLFAPPTRLLVQVDTQQKRLLPVVKELGDEQANAFEERVNELKQRLTDRAANLRQQVAQQDPGPLTFNESRLAELPDWHSASESDDALHEQPELAGSKQTYSIQCGPSGTCVASWRRKVVLQKGRYVLLATAKTKGVVAREDEQGIGAGVRISGSHRTSQLVGTTDWKPLEFEFDIHEEVGEVELVAELRATAGQAWFDTSSLKLKRLPDNQE